MKYDVSKIKVNIYTDDASQDNVFALTADAINNGHYVVEVWCNGAPIFYVDAFNDTSAMRARAYDSWSKYCGTHRVWDYFEKQYCGPNANPFEEEFPLLSKIDY